MIDALAERLSRALDLQLAQSETSARRRVGDAVRRFWLLLPLVWLAHQAAGQSNWGSIEGLHNLDYPASAFDALRRRVVVVGGETHLSRFSDLQWEWEGASWRTTGAVPGLVRGGACAAFDSRRGRLVLFGGSLPAIGLLGDTWEWDGLTWSRAVPSVSPPPRAAAAMCYDEARGRVIVFGGVDPRWSHRSDAWAWDGQNWAQISNGPMLGRIRFGMAYDVQRDRLIVCGGISEVGLTLNDTWEYDGTAWRPGPTAPPRDDQCMFYDRASSRVVMYGGEDDRLVVQGDTWALTGGAWVRLLPSTSPPARAGAVCAYDSVRQCAVIALGRGRTDTWEWDGSDWHLRSLGVPARSRHGMAYDGVGLISFGGRGGNLTFGDTWRFANGVWQQLATQGGPGPRADYAMAFDAGRGVVVMFGSNDPDTWEWDSRTWNRRVLPGPSARPGVSMAYWPTHRHVVLVSGSGSSLETWEYDGSTWRRRTPPVSPADRAYAGLAYEPKRDTMLLHGGYRPGFGRLVDTWEWNGQAWTQLSPAHAPAAASDTKMVTDVARERVVLWSEGGAWALSGQAWEWDGQDWVERTRYLAPPPRSDAAMAYDPVSERVYLHGGTYVSLFLGDTWTYGPITPARFTRHYVGCRSSVGAADLSAARPWLGEPFDFRLTGIPAGSPAVLHLGLSATTLYGIIPLPLDLTALGATGCSLYTDIALSLPMASSATGAQLSLPLCLCPSLLGSVIYCQALAADPRANPAGLVTSNAGVAVLGGK